MFKVTEPAHHVLIQIINQEKTFDEEQLLLRLSMGIG